MLVVSDLARSSEALISRLTGLGVKIRSCAPVDAVHVIRNYQTINSNSCSVESKIPVKFQFVFIQMRDLTVEFVKLLKSAAKDYEPFVVGISSFRR